MMIIGHRGTPGYEPENTIRSIVRAIELGADMVECDIHALDDGNAVIFHDYYVDRTTDGTGELSHMSFEKVRGLDAGKGEHIPMVEEIIEAVDRRVPIDFELKNAGSAVLAAKIIKKYLQDKWQPTDFYVSSFNHHELLIFKSLIPEITLVSLIGALPLDYAAFAETIGSKVVAPDAHLTTIEFVEDAHRRGLQLWAYGSEKLDIPAAQRLYQIGVDGVFTDHADVTRRAFESVHNKRLLADKAKLDQAKTEHPS